MNHESSGTWPSAAIGMRSGSDRLGSQKVLCLLAVILFHVMALYLSLMQRPAEPRISVPPMTMSVRWVAAQMPARVTVPPSKSGTQMQERQVVTAKPAATEGVAPKRLKQPIRKVQRFQIKTESKSGSFQKRSSAQLSQDNQRSQDNQMARPTKTASAIAASHQSTGSLATITEANYRAAYLDNPAPRYPPMSRRLREEGTVLLRVTVSETGMPLAVKISRSSGYSRLDDAARQTVKGWRFEPARQGATAIRASVLVPIIFQLRGRG